MQRRSQGAQYCSSAREDDAWQQELEGEARAGYVGSRDAMQRLGLRESL
jgi:hypothetical protein